VSAAEALTLADVRAWLAAPRAASAPAEAEAEAEASRAAALSAPFRSAATPADAGDDARLAPSAPSAATVRRVLRDALAMRWRRVGAGHALLCAPAPGDVAWLARVAAARGAGRPIVFVADAPLGRAPGLHAFDALIEASTADTELVCGNFALLARVDSALLPSVTLDVWRAPLAPDRWLLFVPLARMVRRVSSSSTPAATSASPSSASAAAPTLADALEAYVRLRLLLIVPKGALLVLSDAAHHTRTPLGDIASRSARKLRALLRAHGLGDVCARNASRDELLAAVRAGVERAADTHVAAAARDRECAVVLRPRSAVDLCPLEPLLLDAARDAACEGDALGGMQRLGARAPRLARDVRCASDATLTAVVAARDDAGVGGEESGESDEGESGTDSEE